MTRERLVPCPSCGVHVRASEVRACPFCGERASSVTLGARGGLVAASLLAITACGEPTPVADEEHSGGEVVVEDVDEYPGEDDGNAPPEEGPDEQADSTPPPDEEPAEPPPAAAYGGPPEPVVQPLYGIAPD
jgi:hypothetical protein